MIDVTRTAHPYYADKRASLTEIFGSPVEVGPDSVTVGGCRYAILDDVIILLPADRVPPAIRSECEAFESVGRALRVPAAADIARDIQSSFGQEWQDYADVLPEHAEEFRKYFDLVDLNTLRDQRVCDLGCGSGRWSTFVAPICREIVLVDFSEAIFVARRNLRQSPHALFFLGDVTALPFAPGTFDFAFSLGVLHHLPIPALEAVIRVSPLARSLLVYLYYALDNRPAAARALLKVVTVAREGLSRISHPGMRRMLARVLTATVYIPCIGLGHVAQVVGKGHVVPLFEWYRGMSFQRIEQDAYDRFFTGIEQRVSRKQIREGLAAAFASVEISDQQPYWHFLCRQEQ